MGAWRVGVDSGGTFTDVCLFDTEAGRVHVWKVSSTPADPSDAIAEGVRQGLEHHQGLAQDIAYFGHGTTVATNALIQGRGARTGLITTAGFRDLLEIARQKRPSLYDLQCDKPVPIVPRRWRIEVPERLRHDGRIETPLDEAALHAAGERLRDAGVEAVAVAFLYAFVDPSHELRAREILAGILPDAFITCSHEVAPEFREYERLSTVVVNAALGPVMSGYISHLAARIDALGVRAPTHITQSNGGVISFETAATQPVRTVLSGPSTGVVGAVSLGVIADEPDVITFDMGGTSTDVSLVQRGKPSRAGEMTVHGHPLKVPMLDINTVGAGGGSIAHIDHGGLLKVGPRSAGADPGPVCYGRGATEPTVTDANVALGVLNPDYLLAGRMKIDRDLAVRAIARLGELLDLSLEEAAQGVISIVTANMAKAIRVISVQRGYDPREFALMAFGGAGPIHAARLARELEIPRIIVPPHPGVLCAMGLLLTDLATDFARTRLTPLDGAVDVIGEEFSRLVGLAANWFKNEGVVEADRLLSHSIDMRYAGQNYELSIPVPIGISGVALLARLKQDFEAEHQRMYGYTAEEEPIQLVTFRLQAVGLTRKSDIAAHPDAETDLEDAVMGRRAVYLPEVGGYVDCPLYQRGALGPGHAFEGPAIIEQMDSTTLVLPGQRARVDRYLNLIVEETGI